MAGGGLEAARLDRLDAQGERHALETDVERVGLYGHHRARHELDEEEAEGPDETGDDGPPDSHGPLSNPAFTPLSR